MQKASQTCECERRAYMVTSKHEKPCDLCPASVSGWYEIEVGHPDAPKRTRICQGCLDAIDRVRVKRVGGGRC